MKKLRFMTRCPFCRAATKVNTSNFRCYGCGTLVNKETNVYHQSKACSQKGK